MEDAQHDITGSRLKAIETSKLFKNFLFFFCRLNQIDQIKIDFLLHFFICLSTTKRLIWMAPDAKLTAINTVLEVTNQELKEEQFVELWQQKERMRQLQNNMAWKEIISELQLPVIQIISKEMLIDDGRRTVKILQSQIYRQRIFSI